MVIDCERILNCLVRQKIVHCLQAMNEYYFNREQWTSFAGSEESGVSRISSILTQMSSSQDSESISLPMIALSSTQV